MAYLNKRGTSECFAPGVPLYKREKDVWLAKFGWLNLCFMRGSGTSL